jgi:hypothetical protein
VKESSELFIENSGEITFGNGIVGQDFSCKIHGAEDLKVLGGTLAYKNVSQDKFNMACPGSTLKICSNAALRLYQDLSLSRGMILFEKDSALLIAEGKNIKAAVSALGWFRKQHF